MSDLIKGVFKGVKKEILYFTEAALRSGTTNVGEQFRNVRRDENQPLGYTFGTITKALKSSLKATGQDLMTTGVERVNAISPNDQKSKASEEST